MSFLALPPWIAFMYKDLRVRRISVGGALARAAWGAFLAAAEEIIDRGTFSHLDGATPFGPLDGRFGKTSGNGAA